MHHIRVPSCSSYYPNKRDVRRKARPTSQQITAPRTISTKHVGSPQGIPTHLGLRHVCRPPWSHAIDHHPPLRWWDLSDTAEEAHARSVTINALSGSSRAPNRSPMTGPRAVLRTQDPVCNVHASLVMRVRLVPGPSDATLIIEVDTTTKDMAAISRPPPCPSKTRQRRRIHVTLPRPPYLIYVRE